MLDSSLDVNVFAGSQKVFEWKSCCEVLARSKTGLFSGHARGLGLYLAFFGVQVPLVFW